MGFIITFVALITFAGVAFLVYTVALFVSAANALNGE
jgi:hypothetical protein